MNRLLVIFSAVALVAGGVFAEAPKEASAKKDAYDIRPTEVKGTKTLAVWQEKNRKALDAATTCEALAAFVETDAAAEALLAQIKPAYVTDPLVMTQIGNVTQLVMCPTCKKAPARRKLWVRALERARAAATDDYIRTFLTQQLDICRF